MLINRPSWRCKKILRYTGKYLTPVFFQHLSSPSVLVGEFKSWRIRRNNICFNTVASGWYQDRGKPFSSTEGQKEHGAKITLYEYVSNLSKVLYSSYLSIFATFWKKILKSMPISLYDNCFCCANNYFLFYGSYFVFFLSQNFLCFLKKKINFDNYRCCFVICIV